MSSVAEGVDVYRTTLFLMGCHASFCTYVTGVALAECKRRPSTDRPFPPTIFAGRESSNLVWRLAQQGVGNRQTLEFAADN